MAIVIDTNTKRLFHAAAQPKPSPLYPITVTWWQRWAQDNSGQNNFFTFEIEGASSTQYVKSRFRGSDNLDARGRGDDSTLIFTSARTMSGTGWYRCFFSVGPPSTGQVKLGVRAEGAGTWLVNTASGTVGPLADGSIVGDWPMMLHVQANYCNIKYFFGVELDEAAISDETLYWEVDASRTAWSWTRGDNDGQAPVDEQGNTWTIVDNVLCNADVPTEIQSRTPAGLQAQAIAGWGLQVPGAPIVAVLRDVANPTHYVTRSFIKAGTPPATRSISGAYLGTSGNPSEADFTEMAKNGFLDIASRWKTRVGGDTWAAMKALNPNVVITNYRDGPQTAQDDRWDTWEPAALYNWDRYNNARGNPLGAANGAASSWIWARDGSGNRIPNFVYQTSSPVDLLDFSLNGVDTPGDSRLVDWIGNSANADLGSANPPVPDGLFLDNCITQDFLPWNETAVDEWLAGRDWEELMANFCSAITARFAADGFVFCPNRGNTRTSTGAVGWALLDTKPNPPAYVCEEAAFVARYGPSDAQFYPDFDILAQWAVFEGVSNSQIVTQSHTDLEGGMDATGTNNWGASFTNRQALWYSLGCYLMARSVTPDRWHHHFGHKGISIFDSVWKLEYEQLLLGNPTGPRVEVPGTPGVWTRPYDQAYVYVNITNISQGASTLPQSCREVTPSNMSEGIPPTTGPTVTTTGGMPAHTMKVFAKLS